MQISTILSSILAVIILAQIHVASSCGCIQVYDPVCCLTSKDGTVETKSNTCTCECSGGSVWFKGECRDPADCFCPLVFDPVCCKLPSGEQVTEGNSCQCGCRNGIVLGVEGGCNNPQNCICPAIFAPVCCKLPSGQLETTSNSCQCACENGTVYGDGPCVGPSMAPTVTPSPSPQVDMPCKSCPKRFNPVCCVSKSGKYSIKRNPCSCTCKNNKITSLYSCLL